MKQELPGFRVTTESGYNWITSMAKGVTLKEAQAYFLGKTFNAGVYPEEKMEKAVKVEQVY